MDINLHNRKIDLDSLVKSSKETVDLPPLSGYYGLFYDRSTGEVWTVYHSNNPLSSWTEYRDDDVLSLGAVSRHVSAQWIADLIDEAIDIDDEGRHLMEEKGIRQPMPCGSQP